MPLFLGDALRAAQDADPASLPAVILQVARDLGAADVVVYLVDFAQTTLEPLPDYGTHAELPSSEDVVASVPGRVFVDQHPATAERADGVRVWVPIVEGSDRTGVLALTVRDATDATVELCEQLGLLAGYLIATHARATDLYNLHRRRRSLSLPASMQWDLLPPLVVRTEQLSLAGILEPAYDVGGDCFDYAINGPTLDLAIFDPVGHGLGSALIAALCVGIYRHDRREGQQLEQIHANLDTYVAAELPSTFATGQLARLELATGTLTWTNAGHPLPLLVRGGQVIKEMACPPTLPWGIGHHLDTAAPPTVATEALEPGDSVLFHTDGVTEAHVIGGEQFGVTRLSDLTGQHAANELEPDQIIRRIVRAVLDHQGDTLNDDATLLLLKWHGPPG
jgi:serine phosphatase RsbU (regulator of sigma subunit)